MALSENGGSNMYMPVAPAYGGGNGGWGNGFGGDGWWVILFLFAMFGGWGGMGFGGGFGGFGNMMLGYDFPWLLTGQQNINNNTNDGFRDQMINTGSAWLRLSRRRHRRFYSPWKSDKQRLSKPCDLSDPLFGKRSDS